MFHIGHLAVHFLPKPAVEILGLRKGTRAGDADLERAETKEVQMTAKKYEFSPSSVEVPVGATVVFKITALDRDHGFEIEGVKDSCVELKKGEIATVEYTAEKAG